MRKSETPFILDTIVAHKREELALDKGQVPLTTLKNRIKASPAPRNFHAAISNPDRVDLIAEVKKQSPSKGIICNSSNSISIAKTYENHGASAISVLTDYTFFGGTIEDLSTIRDSVNKPLLRKDFTIDAYHIYQARASGADAILLIVAILTLEELRKFMRLAEDLELASIVEVHTEPELAVALKTDAKIIGINNRNLETFQTDIQTTFQLRPSIPKEKLVVSESGIATHKHVQELKRANVDAILVGESLMRSNDIGSKIGELMGNTPPVTG